MTTNSNEQNPVDEAEELEFAAELLAANSERELDGFLGRLLTRVSSNSGAVSNPALKALGRLAKGAIHRVFPNIGRSVSTSIESALSGRIGQLASGASHALGLELEGMSPEDQEFEMAKQLVRLVGAAGAGVEPGGPPKSAARRAMVESAREHAPGLLRPVSGVNQHSCGCGSHGACRCHASETGRWVRTGNRIEVLLKAV